MFSLEYAAVKAVGLHILSSFGFAFLNLFPILSAYPPRSFEVEKGVKPVTSLNEPYLQLKTGSI